MRPVWKVGSLGLLLLATSCASLMSSQGQYGKTVPMAQEGRYAEAAALIRSEKDKAYKKKDRVLYFLDLGMLLHWAGQYKESNEILTQAETSIEALYTQSISKGVASFVLNDNVLDYSGEEYEDIYINVFKALNFIAMDDPESAHVETRRALTKINILKDKYAVLVDEYNKSENAGGEISSPKKSQFHDDVLARYLSFLLYRTEKSYDDARIDKESMENAWKTIPSMYDFPQPSLPETRPPKDGKALLNVLSFSGLAPLKLADTLRISTSPGFAYITTEGQSEDYTKNMYGFSAMIMPSIGPDLYYKIQLPRLELRGSKVTKIVLKLDGEPKAELQTLEKLEKIAQEVFLMKQPFVVGKTILRAITKGSLAGVGKNLVNEGLKDEGLAGALLGFAFGLAADITVDSTENADLRSSQFFPAKAWLSEISVNPGTYNVELEYWGEGTLLKTIDYETRTFTENKLNFIESYFLR